MNNVARIVIGSKFQFKIYLVDEFGRPVSLSPFASGKVVFVNAAGTRTEIALTVPGSNPDRGELTVIGTSTQAAAADKLWGSADVVLVEGDGNTTIVPLTNMFDIVTRNTPSV